MQVNVFARLALVKQGGYHFNTREIARRGSPHGFSASSTGRGTRKRVGNHYARRNIDRICGDFGEEPGAFVWEQSAELSEDERSEAEADVRERRLLTYYMDRTVRMLESQFPDRHVRLRKIMEKVRHQIHDEAKQLEQKHSLDIGYWCDDCSDFH